MKKQTKLDKHISCTFSLPFSLFTKIVDEANKRDITMSKLVREMIETYFNIVSKNE